MYHITQNGASFSTDFVKGFKKVEAFIKAMDGNIPEWTGDERDKRLKSVWNQAKGKEVEVIQDPEITESEETV